MIKRVEIAEISRSYCTHKSGQSGPPRVSLGHHNIGNFIVFYRGLKLGVSAQIQWRTQGVIGGSNPSTLSEI